MDDELDPEAKKFVEAFEEYPKLGYISIEFTDEEWKAFLKYIYRDEE